MLIMFSPEKKPLENWIDETLLHVVDSPTHWLINNKIKSRWTALTLGNMEVKDGVETESRKYEALDFLYRKKSRWQRL